MRASDAALYCLARMIESGEDPKFVAREIEGEEVYKVVIYFGFYLGYK